MSVPLNRRNLALLYTNLSPNHTPPPQTQLSLRFFLLPASTQCTHTNKLCSKKPWENFSAPNGKKMSKAEDRNFLFKVAKKTIEDNWNSGGKSRDGWTSHKSIPLIFVLMKPHWFFSLASKRASFICSCLFFKTLVEGKSIANTSEETCENFHSRSAFVGFWKAVFNSWYNKMLRCLWRLLWKICVLEGWLDRDDGVCHSGRENTKQ